MYSSNSDHEEEIKMGRISSVTVTSIASQFGYDGNIKQNIYPVSFERSSPTRKETQRILNSDVETIPPQSPSHIPEPYSNDVTTRIVDATNPDLQ